MKHNENRRKGAKNGASARGRPPGLLMGEGSGDLTLGPGSASVSGDGGGPAGGGGSDAQQLPRAPKAARAPKRPRPADVRPPPRMGLSYAGPPRARTPCWQSLHAYQLHTL